MKLPTKGLIIKREWLLKIFNKEHPKIWEVRGTNTKMRGKIALIESGTKTIVGECIIEDSFTLSEKTYNENTDNHQIEAPYSKLPYTTPHAWVLSSVVEYSEPIPYVHKKGVQIWVNLED